MFNKWIKKNYIQLIWLNHAFLTEKPVWFEIYLYETASF